MMINDEESIPRLRYWKIYGSSVGTKSRNYPNIGKKDIKLNHIRSVGFRIHKRRRRYFSSFLKGAVTTRLDLIRKKLGKPPLVLKGVRSMKSFYRSKVFNKTHPLRRNKARHIRSLRDYYADRKIFWAKIQPELPNISSDGKHQVGAYIVDPNYDDIVYNGNIIPTAWFDKVIRASRSTSDYYLKLTMESMGYQLFTYPYRLEFDTEAEKMIFLLKHG